MKIPLGGRRLSLDLGGWTPGDRFAASVSLAGVTAALVLLGLAVQLLAPSIAGWAVPLLLGASVLALGVVGAVNFVGLDVERRAPPAPARRLDLVTLRCPECRTIFDLEDPGYRPLYHACPGCGTHGVLDDAEAPAGEAAPMPAPVALPPPTSPLPPPATRVPPPPEPVPEEALPPPERAAPPPEPPATFEPAAPPAPPKRKKFKVTCKQCATPNIVADTGERPLAYTCEKCGRTAKLNVA